MQQKQYDGPPSKFVNVKRVKMGEDSKGRETITATFGLTTTADGTEVNTLDQLINALLELQGKQANVTLHIEEKTSQNGSKFPVAFARVTEMIPKSQGQVRFTPKASKADSVKARAAEINKTFKG